MSKWDKVDNAYEFLLEKEGQDAAFSKKDLDNCSHLKSYMHEGAYL